MTTEVSHYTHAYNIRDVNVYPSEADDGAVKIEFRCTVNRDCNETVDDAVVCLELPSDVEAADFIGELTVGLVLKDGTER